jgi:hypothetical protein
MLDHVSNLTVNCNYDFSPRKCSLKSGRTVYMEFNLSFGCPARNLFTCTCPLLTAEPLLSLLVLATLSCKHCWFNVVSCFCILYKYSLQCCEGYVQIYNMVLNRNHLYTVPLYSILHLRNAVESFVGNIQTAECHEK